MIPFLILALLIVVLVILWDITRELKTQKEELAAHYRLIASIERNVAELLTKAEEEGDI